ncbi:transglutaminase domain-containing protein [uncultured Tyzzerella sp.]|uniref:transglutaminase domain-containing protein n=1 Tax=uncultured Tyzzerella sp. TaxID=2321398 RepID=UPI002942FCD1|nr:transglutaminase domain-containing protein [uncultured Tyzzerella sp.]
MLTSLEQEKIELKFKNACDKCETIKNEILEVLKECNEDESFCLKFLYAYMPLTDMADYSPKLFLKFVRHSLKVRNLMPWGKSISDIDFLNYVLQYRINNENIEYFFEIFFDELYPKIKDLSMYDAIIEVNYWAFSKATYKASDNRTASPLTVVRNAYGRCGEESTFLVAALRSVCLPSRQCYAPRWAHCDDNHAWVEVLADNKWHFLGACEPEIRLDTGWFRLPASKAPLIHNRVFCDMVGNEIITKQTDMVTEINVLHHYAKTKEIKVKIVDRNNNPLKDINVAFEVVNYCEFFPIATIKTDENGEVTFVTGLGDLFVFAYNEDSYVYKKIDVNEIEMLTLVFDSIKEETESFELEMTPAKGGIDEEDKLTEEKEQEQAKRNEDALNTRRKFEATFYNEETSKAYSLKFDCMQEDIEKIMPLARGNYKEIEKFLEDESTKNIVEYKVLLLKALREKDLSDITYTILMENIEESMKYKDKYEKEIFVENVLNPRVWNENITLYKKDIPNILSDDVKKEITNNPLEVAKFVENNITQYGVSEYTNLTTSPLGALKSKLVNKVSKAIVTVAILRSLGIAAKMDKADGKVVYYNNGQWIHVYKEPKKDVKKGTLVLKKGDETAYEYYKNYTLGKLENGCYTTLDLDNINWDNDKVEYNVEIGNYRIVLANRRPDETNMVKVLFVKVLENETSEVTLHLPQIKHTGKEVDIEDRTIFDTDDNKTTLIDALNHRKGIVAWLHVGMEPTEHLLNEIRESSDKYNNENINTILILRDIKDLNDPTLTRTLKVVPNLNIYIEKDGYNIDKIYNDLDITDKKLPLAVVFNDNEKVIYGCAGYNVGIGEMLLKTLNS